MRKQIITAIALTSIVFVVGCARQGEAEDAPEVAETEESAEAVAQANVAEKERELQASLPPPEITPVSITVNLSSAAEAEFAKTGETILLDVVYGGDPTQAGQAQVNELGVVELARIKREVKGGETITLDEDVINKSLLPMTIGQPQLMVNTTSGRKSSQNNVLSCSFYWETLSRAGESGVVIPCQLLSEVIKQ